MDGGEGVPLVGKKGKVPMMDLGDDDDDEDDGDGMMEKENKAYEQLKKVLTKCQLCGPTKFCKINKAGEHICLGFTLILHILAICNPYFRYPYTYIHSLKYIFTELLYISRMMKPTPTI